MQHFYFKLLYLNKINQFTMFWGIYLTKHFLLHLISWYYNINNHSNLLTKTGNIPEKCPISSTLRLYFSPSLILKKKQALRSCYIRVFYRKRFSFKQNIILYTACFERFITGKKLPILKFDLYLTGFIPEIVWKEYYVNWSELFSARIRKHLHSKLTS